MTSQLAIEAHSLEKSYGKVPVLRGLNLAVASGSVFALLGPNGSGKTTTVRILSTLLRADEGQAFVAGFDIERQRRQVRSRISLTGQYAAIDEFQTGQENLRMMAGLVGLSRDQARKRAEELLERFDLTEAGDRRVSTYSGGMRRRLDLAASLVGQPSVIFLDEPTVGLDPRSRNAMWDVIGDLVRTGVTIFLTTQYLDEADYLADRIAVLDGGRVVAQGSPDQLKGRVAESRLDIVAVDSGALVEVDRRLGNRAIMTDAGTLTIGIATDGSAAGVRALLDEIDPQRCLIARFSTHRATLDDVFLALTSVESNRVELEVAHA